MSSAVCRVSCVVYRLSSIVPNYLLDNGARPRRSMLRYALVHKRGVRTVLLNSLEVSRRRQ
jgi:hypothetical protein